MAVSGRAVVVPGISARMVMVGVGVGVGGYGRHPCPQLWQ